MRTGARACKIGAIDRFLERTVEGAEATLSTRGGKLMIDRATVVKADVEASNGVIHVIDSVIVPKMQVYSLVESQSGGASAPPFLPWPESAAPRKAGEPGSQE